MVVVVIIINELMYAVLNGSKLIGKLKAPRLFISMRSDCRICNWSRKEKIFSFF